jgi:electron transport complex protein RnfA
MAELALIVVGALLVNNFVLAQFLGLCPFIGVSGNYDTAVAMGFATTFVLTLAAAVSYMAYHWLLLPLGLEFLRVIVFIVVIAALVQLTEVFLRNTSPVLHNALGIYLPLITTNCAVLGVALLAINHSLSLLGTVAYAIGAAVGFTMVLVVFAAMRERLAHAEILSLAFLGFAGLGN